MIDNAPTGPSSHPVETFKRSFRFFPVPEIAETPPFPTPTINSQHRPNGRLQQPFIHRHVLWTGTAIVIDPDRQAGKEGLHRNPAYPGFSVSKIPISTLQSWHADCPEAQ
jgi:hypothetical protein